MATLVIMCCGGKDIEGLSSVIKKVSDTYNTKIALNRFPNPPFKTEEMDPTAKNFTNLQANVNKDPLSTGLKDQVPFDVTSRKGKFGWLTVAFVHLPYILRNEKKYVAVRMVGKKLIDKYVNCLNSNVYANNRIKACIVTDSEAELLTEIVQKHGAGNVGGKRFSKQDLVVPLEEVVEFYEFVYFCHVKIINLQSPIKNYCGFIEIGESIVPYIKKQKKKYVPMMFFEGVPKDIINKCITVDSWDLAYLRFHCHIIGIKHAVFDANQCSVIDIAILPGPQEFKEYWPSKLTDIGILIKSEKSVYQPWFVIVPYDPQ